MLLHPIIQKSFEIIDREIGSHQLSEAEYAVVRRVIHSTADFEFKTLLQFSPSAISTSIRYLQDGRPIVTDVEMVAVGVRSMAQSTFQNPVVSALDYAGTVSSNTTRTETGLLNVFDHYPDALYVIGNAPTALLALCRQVQARQQTQNALCPSVIVGAPVGFVSVLESKDMLSQTQVEQVVVRGRKGGSAVAAAIINALLCLAWEHRGHDL